MLSPTAQFAERNAVPVPSAAESHRKSLETGIKMDVLHARGGGGAKGLISPLGLEQNVPGGGAVKTRWPCRVRKSVHPEEPGPNCKAPG